MNREQNQRAPRDLGTSSDRAMFSPSESRDEDAAPESVQGHGQSQEQAGRPERAAGRDAGRTQGGGSGGHRPSQDIQDQADIRNNPKELND